MFRSMFPRSSSARRARFILSAGANRDARSSDRVHCRTLNTGHTLSQIQLLDPPCRTRSTKDAPSSSNRRCAGAARALDQPFSKKRLQLSDGDGPTFQKCWSFGPPIIHAIIAIDSSRPPAWQAHRTHPYPHTPVPPNPAVEPLPASLLNTHFFMNSFFRTLPVDISH